MVRKRSRIVNLILKKKNYTGGLILPNFKTKHKITMIETTWNEQKNGHIDNRLESPEMDHRATVI